MRVRADGFIEARRRCSRADRVVSRSDRSYRGGSFVFSRRMWGTLFTILKVQDGLALFNFLPFLKKKRGGGLEVKSKEFPSEPEKTHYR